MPATDWDGATFEAHRPLLFSIAYRMLGSASEAEDVIQDAWLRARQDEHADVRSPRAYLTTIVTRLCIDHLRSAERTRMEYPGPWLPEPLAEPSRNAATRPVLGADRIAKFLLGYAGKRHWSESDFQLVTINGAPGLLMRHLASGIGTYSFDIADGRIRAI
jgi:DNA-directed RNA polymerase specialized sigma24 family protein